MSQAGHDHEPPADDDRRPPPDDDLGWPEPTPLFTVEPRQGNAEPEPPKREFDWSGLWREKDGSGALRPEAPEPPTSIQPPVAEEHPFVEARRRAAPHRVVLAGIHLILLVAFVAALVATLVAAAMLLLTFALRAAVT